MSSLVASLLVEVEAMLPSRPTRSAAELVGATGVGVAVTDSTPTKLPNSASDGVTSGSGDAAIQYHVEHNCTIHAVFDCLLLLYILL